jgi:hypothetical protein
MTMDTTALDREVDALIAAGGVLYADIREQIRPGDLLALHHDFVASWYGVQIEAVQRFTGPFAHIAVFDRITLGADERVVVYESVVPLVRPVPVSVTAAEAGGFFWLPMRRPMSDLERRAWWDVEIGGGEYSKPGAVLAGAAFAGLMEMPAGEDHDPRRWCAKAVGLRRRDSGVELGPHYVPTAQIAAARRDYGAPLVYVRMK